MKITDAWISAAIVVVMATGAFAGAQTYNLPDDNARLRTSPLSGYELASVACSACHSVDYITTQPPRLGRNFWQTEVAKMITVYRAPITPDDVGPILDYLAVTY